MRRYLWNLLIAVDRLGNAVIAGSPDETISSRMGKYAHHKRSPKCYACRAITRGLCRLLDLIDPGHCLTAIEEELSNGCHSRDERLRHRGER